MLMFAMVAKTSALAAGNAEYAAAFNIDLSECGTPYQHEFLLQKVGGSYADQSMKIAVIPSCVGNLCDLQATESSALMTVAS